MPSLLRWVTRTPLRVTGKRKRWQRNRALEYHHPAHIRASVRVAKCPADRLSGATLSRRTRPGPRAPAGIFFHLARLAKIDQTLQANETDSSEAPMRRRKGKKERQGSILI